MKVKIKYILLFLVFCFEYSKAQIDIEYPKTVDLSDYELMNINSENNNLLLTWFKQEDVLVMGNNETESLGKVVKKSQKAKNNSTQFILGGNIYGTHGDNLTVPYGRGGYVVVKQLIDTLGKNIEIRSITPIAFRHFEKDSIYNMYFQTVNPLFKTSKVKVKYNLAGLVNCKELTFEEVNCVLKKFIDNYDSKDGYRPSYTNTYDELRNTFSDFKTAFDFPAIPEGQKFKKMFSIGEKTIILTRDKRYKNEKGSQFNLYDASDYKNLLLLDSNYTKDEASLDQEILVHKPNGKLAGLLLSYTLEKLNEKEDNDYSRMLVYLEENNKVSKVTFKNGKSKGFLSHNINYAIDFGDSLLIENYHYEKKSPLLIESWSFKKSNEIVKTTSTDSLSLFKKSNMTRLGYGWVNIGFANGDSKFHLVNMYNKQKLNYVVFQAKDIITTCEGCMPDPTKNNYSLPTISVFNGSKLIGSARLFYNYNSSSPIKTEVVFKDEQSLILLFKYPDNNIIVRISDNGTFKVLETKINKEGFQAYTMINENMFYNTNSKLYLVQKNFLLKKYRLDKIN